MTQIKKIPTLSELVEYTPEKEKENQLLYLLNQQPPEKWTKTLPNTTVKYLPIERIEFLLTNIFGSWSVEVKQVQVIANSVTVTVRLYYEHPITKETLWQDGIGAFAMQTNKGAAAADINNLKTNAVMLAAPAAETEAIKDAAHKIGALFGGNLNRKEQIAYESLLVNPLAQEEELKQLWDAKNSLLNEEEHKAIKRIIDNKEKTGYERAIKLLKSK